MDGTGSLSCPMATFGTSGVIQLIRIHNRSKNTLYHQTLSVLSYMLFRNVILITS
jgi:hypothetical protein